MSYEYMKKSECFANILNPKGHSIISKSSRTGSRGGHRETQAWRPGLLETEVSASVSRRCVLGLFMLQCWGKMRWISAEEGKAHLCKVRQNSTRN